MQALERGVGGVRVGIGAVKPDRATKRQKLDSIDAASAAAAAADTATAATATASATATAATPTASLQHEFLSRLVGTLIAVRRHWVDTENESNNIDNSNSNNGNYSASGSVKSARRSGTESVGTVRSTGMAADR